MTRVFKLVQKYDGIKIAEVYEFQDGQTIVKWLSDSGSVGIHKSLEEFTSIVLNNDRLLILSQILSL